MLLRSTGIGGRTVETLVFSSLDEVGYSYHLYKFLQNFKVLLNIEVKNIAYSSFIFIILRLIDTENTRPCKPKTLMH